MRKIKIEYEKGIMGYIKNECPFYKKEKKYKSYVGGKICTTICKHFQGIDKNNEIVECSFADGWFSKQLFSVKKRDEPKRFIPNLFN